MPNLLSAIVNLQNKLVSVICFLKGFVSICSLRNIYVYGGLYTYIHTYIWWWLSGGLCNEIFNYEFNLFFVMGLFGLFVSF